MTYPATGSPVERVLAAQERFTVEPAATAEGVLAGLTVAAREMGAPLPVERNLAEATEGNIASPTSRQRRIRVFTPSPPCPARARETPLPGTHRARCTTI
jgi:hypothetical protein